MCGLGCIVLGSLGVLAAARFALRRRYGCAHGGCGHGHGGCGHGQRGGFSGFGGGFRRRGGDVAQRMQGWTGAFLARELELNPRQKEEVEGVLTSIREALAELRGARADLGGVAGAFGDEAFDKARVDALADQRLEAIGKARQVIIDGLDQLHAVLIPEQRRRLRELLARLGGPSDEAPL